MITLEQLNQFIKELAMTDWYYDYSDDSRVYRRGKDQVEDIRTKASKEPIYHSAYNIWREHLANKIDRATCEERLNTLRAELTP